MVTNGRWCHHEVVDWENDEEEMPPSRNDQDPLHFQYVKAATSISSSLHGKVLAEVN